jgi:hypothetical protein
MGNWELGIGNWELGKALGNTYHLQNAKISCKLITKLQGAMSEVYPI